MLSDYTPILLFAGLVAAFGILSLAVSSLIRPNKPTGPKTAPYESGITPVRLPRSERFPVKFYVVAMLFIIFDIETIFLYPWAVAFRRLGLFGFVEMLVFIGLVFVAYVYVWQKGGFEWEGPSPFTRAAAMRGRGPMPSRLERGPGEDPDVAPELEQAAEPEPDRAGAPAGGR
jgi:NADH-quinone oxidoreductase subunit A